MGTFGLDSLVAASYLYGITNNAQNTLNQLSLIPPHFQAFPLQTTVPSTTTIASLSAPLASNPLLGTSLHAGNLIPQNTIYQINEFNEVLKAQTLHNLEVLEATKQLEAQLTSIYLHSSLTTTKHVVEKTPECSKRKVDTIYPLKVEEKVVLKKRKVKLCTVPGCKTQDKGGGKCAKHGGGKKCLHEGCNKIVAGGRLCSLHGGKRKKTCQIEGCSKGDQGGGFCARHGGGRKCSREGCAKRSVGMGLCWGHGGGKRCLHPGCNRGVRGSKFCKLHG
eukprot:snap_masked-scaffold_6-processed-gene-11.58-mRNA-1 protein AED:0.10 eAED:0.10 QI:0/-1/0/1/-1/1/1/0/276